MPVEELVSAEAPAALTTSVETTEAPEPAAETEGGDESSIDDDLRAIFEKNNSRETRGPNGRFAKPIPDQSPATDTGKPTPDAAPAIPPPQSWSADVKAKWASLPPDVQAYVAKRDQDAHEHISQQGRQIATLEPLQRVAELGKPTFDRYGVPIEEGVAQLLQANEYLERDAPSAIRDLAAAYGVDLRALVGNQPGNVPQPAQVLHDRISQLERQNNELSNRVLTRERAETDREAKTVESQIADFAKDKTDFEALEDDILDQIVILKQKLPDAANSEILNQAYERARWANPGARAKAIEAEEVKRMAAAKKRSGDASRAATLNVKSSTANASAAKSLDDDLKELAKRLYSN